MKKLNIILILFICILAFTLAYSSALENLDKNKISPYILEKLNTQETIEVDVYLEDPDSHELLSNEKYVEILNEIENSKISKIYEEAFIAELTKKEIETLSQRNEVTYIVPHLRLMPFLEDSIEIIDADLVWQKEVNEVYLTGEGKTVCVVDYAVDFSHPDLADKDILNGVRDCTTGVDCPLSNPPITNSHGTKVAGIVAASGNIFGIAKDTNLISMQVFEAGNEDTDSLFIKRAVNWCVDHAEEYNISAITISIGSEELFSESCDFIYTPLTTAINNAFDNNIPVTIATGNSGSSTGIAFPSCISNSIAVASTNKDDTLASFSNYNSLVKLFAPGSSINSTCLEGNYCLSSGTSFSTPMVAGSASILTQYLDLIDSTMNPLEIESLLYETGEDIIGLSEDFSRININNALTSIDAIPPEVSLIYPHTNLILGKQKTYKFKCRATDWNNIPYLQFDLWDRYRTLIYSEQRETSGTNVKEVFILSGPLEAGEYFWNCLAEDSLGNQGSAKTSNVLIIQNNTYS